MRGGFQVGNRFEQGGDLQAGITPGPTSQEQDSQHICGRVGHRNHDRTEKLRPVDLEDAANQLEHGPGFGGGSGDARVIGKFRAGFSQQAHQQVNPLGTGQVLKIRGQPKGTQNLAQGSIQPAGILAEIEAGRMQAKNLQLAVSSVQFGLDNGRRHGA